MRNTVAIDIKHFGTIRTSAPHEAMKSSKAIILDSNNLTGWGNGSIHYLAAIGEVGMPAGDLISLRQQHDESGDWMLGFICYSFKDRLEDLKSGNTKLTAFPDTGFFTPKYLIIKDKDGLRMEYHQSVPEEEALNLINRLTDNNIKSNFNTAIELKEITPRESYIETVEKIKEHIRRGDIYEINYCISSIAENIDIEPAILWDRLCNESPTPFAAFVKHHNQFSIVASPERYLLHNDGTITSQPIKGTAARDSNKDIDLQNKESLGASEKERAENIMITDLVRNDMSKVAESGTVKVRELCGIYGFRQVWQMISTIDAKLDTRLHWTDAIAATFPMGSMTGAPKYKAMQLAEQFEDMDRGLFSGTIGFITPSGNFDFNVVIRSIFYDGDNKRVSFSAGSAITIGSDAEKEYDECRLKTSAIRKTLNIPQ